MDALAGLLDGPRARGAFLLRSSWSGLWGLRIMAEAPLTVLAAPRGEFWVVHEGREPVRVGPGDLAITRGPDHYIVADHPDTEPTIEIHPGQDCRSLTGEPLVETMSLGLRSWGNHHDGETVMMVGAYSSFGEIGDQLVRALPPIIHLPPDEWEGALVPILCDEVLKDHLGQTAVLDRLLDLLVVAALRAWFDRPEAEPPAWYRAQSDPIVGTALRLMQSNPAKPWTVASIASEAGVSRALLARRFNELVGKPPMSFLTQWRIDLAADLLRRPDTTVGAIAQQVGYSTPFALSTAFKRLRGISPQAHRALVTA
ncbi:MAG: AraC family transcriptional regulator [Actinomycetota bacterium]|nr:AraC family transcriptional regulator [Actinomycetota bacterium]